MAEDKKSFVLYTDSIGLIKQLPDDVSGRLFKHIFAYVNDENPESDELLLNIAFEPIKQQLKRDLIKYEKKREQWSEAGKRSAEKRALNNSTVVDSVERSLTVVDSVATVSTVSVSDSVSVNDINNILMSEIKISHDKKGLLFNSSIIEDDDLVRYYDIADKFRLLFIKNCKDRNAPTTHQDNAKFKSYVDPIRLIFERDNVSKEQVREVYQYLNHEKGEFWKGNILSTKTLRDKLPQILLKKNEPIKKPNYK